MLPSKYRLSTSFFKEIAQQERKPDQVVSSKYFSAKIYFSRNDFSRFAVVANSSSFKKAVLRNRLRRIVYEILRKGDFFKKPGLDVVVVLRPQASFLNQETRKELEEEIKKIFS